MTPSIVVIETEHFEVLDPVVHLLLLLDAEIHVISNQQVYNCSSYKDQLGIKWHMLDESLTNRESVKEMKRIIGTLHIQNILLLTVSNNHFSYAQLKKRNYNLILCIHDLNSYLIPQVKFTIRGLVRYWGRKFLYKKADQYLVLCEKQAKVLQEQTTKLVSVAPPALFKSVQFNPRSYSRGQELLVVVPGSIDPKRRRYDEVLSLAALIEKEDLPIRLILLGHFPTDANNSFKFQLQEIRNKIQNKIEYFDEHVPLEIFLEYLNKAHFIWAPVQKVFDNNGESWETYGVTKISGSVYDSIRAGRPLLLPDYYVVDNRMLSTTQFYRSLKDVSEILKFIIDHPEHYASFQLKALNAGMEYIPEKWLDQFKKIIKLKT